MEWSVDFKGEQIPKKIKKLIDELPEDIFFPKEVRVKSNPIPTEFEDLENFIKDIQEPSDKELINHLKQLEFPEPLLKKREIEVRGEEEKKLIETKREEEEKIKISQELEAKVIKNAQEREIFIEKVSDYIQDKLNKPTETLLHEFYDPKEDSVITPQILYHFERTGTFLHQKKEVINEEIELKKYQQEKNKELEEEKIEIEVEIPKNLPKDPIELRKALEKYDKEKKELFSKLENEMKEKKFQILIGLQNYKELNRNNEWKEYIDMNFIKPNEKEYFSKTQIQKNMKSIEKVNIVENIPDDSQKISYQFENPLLQDDILKSFIKSKL